jgi:hypothetical protein
MRNMGQTEQQGAEEITRAHIDFLSAGGYSNSGHREGNPCASETQPSSCSKPGTEL